MSLGEAFRRLAVCVEGSLNNEMGVPQADVESLTPRLGQVFFTSRLRCGRILLSERAAPDFDRRSNLCGYPKSSRSGAERSLIARISTMVKG